MSRSSPRSERSTPFGSDRARPLGRHARGQVEPTAALAAVVAVVLGLSAYAVVLGDAAPADADRSLAPPTLERAHDRLATDGVVGPDRLSTATRAAGPDGHDVNATLRAAGRTWAVGPAPPARSADRASRPVAVGVAPGRVRAGDLRVVVWS